MINVYSINDILEASNNILNSSAESKVVLSSDKNELVNKKNISVIEDKTLSIKSDVVKENTFNVLEKIILEAESSPLNINNKLDDRIEHIDEKNLLEQNTISQKKLIEDLYKTFGKKIKKNSLKLILELRKDIINLTQNISSLTKNKKEIEKKNIKLNQNINNFKEEKINLQNNLDQSINGFNKLNYEHGNLKSVFNNLEENLLEDNKKLDVYLEEINQLKLKNKDLENTIDKLKSYEDSNDQNLNIIKELENKIKYYQEENIRISNQLYEANKRFDIIKSEIEVLQDQRSSLIAKINSVNDVIGNSKIVTNVFQNSQPKNTQIVVKDPTDKKIQLNKDIDEQIMNIFSK